MLKKICVGSFSWADVVTFIIFCRVNELVKLPTSRGREKQWDTDHNQSRQKSQPSQLTQHGRNGRDHDGGGSPPSGRHMYMPSNYGQGSGIQEQDYNPAKSGGKMYQQQGNRFSKEQQHDQRYC